MLIYLYRLEFFMLIFIIFQLFNELKLRDLNSFSKIFRLDIIKSGMRIISISFGYYYIYLNVFLQIVNNVSMLLIVEFKR